VGAKGDPAGPLRVVPVGRSYLLPGTGGLDDPGPIELYLLAAIECPGLLALTVTLHRPAAGPEERPLRTDRITDRLTATDDRGGSYRLGFSGMIGPEIWDGYLDVRPEPPAGLRWLDLRARAGDPPVRIPLTDPAAAAFAAPPTIETAPAMAEEHWPASPGSALTRSAAAPAAGLLPTVDGARFALAGLVTGPGGTVAHLVGTGLAEPGAPGRRGVDQPFSWWWRDGGPGGGWREVVENGYEQGLHGELRLRLAIHPALSPADRDVELTVSGPATRARARLRLDWQPLPW
jgi:hypothetical protein